MARLSRETGAVYDFIQNASGYIGNADSPGSLTQILDVGVPAGWQYENAQGEIETYNVDGFLTGINNRTERLVIQHDGNGNVAEVTDDKGRSLHYAYSEDNRLLSISTPGGSLIKYQYEDSAYPGILLSDVEYPGGATKSYHYDYPNYSGPLLTSVVDENGSVVSTYTYNSNGYPLTSVQAGGVGGVQVGTGYSYTDPLGATHTFAVQNAGGAQRITGETVACTGCVTRSMEVHYDIDGNVQSLTDLAGNVTSYAFDPVRFLETSRTEAANDASSERTIETDWHPVFRLPSERRTKDANGLAEAKTKWTYNSRGQTTARCEIDVDVAGADGYACGAGTNAPPGVRQWRYAYCEQADVTAKACPIIGLLKSVNGPRSMAEAGMGGGDDTATFTYYQTDDPACVASHICRHRHGDLWKVTDALGRVTETVSYDGDGRPTRVKDPNGTYTDFVYHARGWLTDRIVRDDASGTPSAKDATTHIDYDAAGNITKVTQPDGDFLSYTYDDARRLIKITDALGNSIDYCPGGVGSAECLDAAGNRRVEQIEDPSHTIRRSLHRVYDALGHLQKVLNAASQPTFDATSGYDGNGNLVQSADGLGIATQQTYDGLNRLVKTLQNYNGVDPATSNTETDYAYDARDHLRSVTDPDGLVTSYTYDGLDNLTDLSSPDTGHTSYAYDRAGNRTSQTDARGVTSTYTYDALNRLVAVSYPTSSLNVTYAYDQSNAVTGCATSYPIGRLTTMTDGSGSTTYCYDRRGNVIRKTQVTGSATLTTQYGYTVGDRLASITYPSGIVVTYTRDAGGRVTGVLAKVGANNVKLITHATYYPFGPLNELAFGNGRTQTKTYDQDYAIDAITSSAANGLTLDFGVDVMGNITSASHTMGPPTPERTYGYDPLYRLTTVQNGATPLEAYTYGKTGDRLSASLNGAAAVPYTYVPGTHHLASVGGIDRTYDANGNTQTGIGALTLTYDDKNRLSSAGPNYLYFTNGRGERVRKGGMGPLGTAPTLFTYDESGQLIGEYNDNGTAKAEYVYLDNLPIAVIKGTAVAYVETDHLGTPRQVIDAATNGPVWKWDFLGNAFGTSAPMGPPLYTLNLRFPGQYFDAETGVNHNGWRDYDGMAGRYLQSDPIGLYGGLNSYAYVGSDPLISFDPQGLVRWHGTQVAIGAAAAFGGSLFRFDLTSDCVHGKQGHAIVYAVGPTFGIEIKGVPEVGMTNSSASFDDDLDEVNPDVFNGSFINYGIGFSLVGGYGCSVTRVGGWGGALSSGTRSGAISVSCGPQFGFDASIATTGGTATVLDSSIHDCACKQ
jgi:RHS repeat-associated protein